MTTIFMQSSPLAARFGHRFGFADDRKAWRRCPNSAFGPAGRFSTRFGTLGWCAKLHQNAGHHPTYLSRGDRPLLAFPRTQERLSQVLTQQQLIARTGHDPTPAFELLRRAQMRRRPEQVLLEKAIAMLVREALAIPGAHLLQRDLLLVGPHEPTLTRVAFAVTGGFALDADHTDFDCWRLAEMQATPAGDHHPLAVLIDPFPLGIGRSIGLGACPLKERAMFARRAALLRLAGRRCPIQLAIAFEPDQCSHSQLTAGAHKGGSGVPAICQQDDPTSWHQRQQPTQASRSKTGSRR